MLTELVLTHPCGEEIVWSAGSFYSPRSKTRSRPITQCRRCREWLGTPFVRAEAGAPALARAS